MTVPVRPGEPVAPGDVSAEELSAILAVVAALAADNSDDDSTDHSETDRPRLAAGSVRRSPWGSPAGALRVTHPHGPTGWRASARPV